MQSPAQVTGDSDGLYGRSGKLDRATEMISEIVDDGDRALIFTQYRTMGEMLSRHLGAELGIGAVPFLHGGLNTDKRDAMVDAFQNDTDSPPVLILSLRAAASASTSRAQVMSCTTTGGGTQPSRIKQTDRAHRIGQKRTVNVHTW